VLGVGGGQHHMVEVDRREANTRRNLLTDGESALDAIRHYDHCAAADRIGCHAYADEPGPGNRGSHGLRLSSSPRRKRRTHFGRR
jgi:hypothetical protein